MSDSQRFTFEVWLRNSKVGYEMFSRAVFKTGARVLSCRMIAGPSALIDFDDLAKVVLFTEVAKLWEPPKYKSPCVVERATIIAMYDSPEDQAAGRVSKRAADAIERQKAREERSE